MLCAVFQIDTIVPRSDLDHQCTIVRPHGGQPIPWNQPFKKIITHMMAIPEVAHGNKPIMVIQRPESNKPNGKNTRGFERSDIPAITNLDKP